MSAETTEFAEGDKAYFNGYDIFVIYKNENNKLVVQFEDGDMMELYVSELEALPTFWKIDDATYIDASHLVECGSKENVQRQCNLIYGENVALIPVSRSEIETTKYKPVDLKETVIATINMRNIPLEFTKRNSAQAKRTTK